jgi:hypothetical protein
MTTGRKTNDNTTESWDQLYEALASQPRRMIIFSLMKEPEGERLPLPDAARAPDRSTESGNLSLQLRHHHLPKLAEAGYVHWESEPFSVRRGPHFDEPALVISKMTESTDDHPGRLREECVVIGEVTENG